MNYSQIQQDFQRAYSRSAWSHMISQIFPGAQIWARPDKLTDIDNHAAQEAYRLGQITLDENGIERTISVFEVQLAPGIVLERNRVGLRNLLKKYWKFMDGAFVSYYQPGKSNWRFTYVSELTGWDSEGEQYKIQTEPKRYTYILGETETCRTAAERFAILSEKGRSAGLKDVMDAFSVEKLSKAFFDEYKLHYQKFCDFMLSKPGISTALFSNDDKAIRDFAKKMLGRIVFLYFIQKKGWLGVPVGKTWGEGDPQFLTNLFNLAPFKPLFYSTYLTKLFFDTLNTPRANDEIEIIPGDLCRIPYLNGGLFEEINPIYRQINFPPELFSGLFEFFSHYNFTIYEDDPDDQIVAVDPEMLGHIFENLLEDNKDKGAYYTPKEIVHYMCQESLTEYLATWFEQKGYQVTGYREFAKQDEPLLFPPNEGRIGQQVLEIAADSPDKAIDRLIIENLLKKRLSTLNKVIIIRHADEINKALDNVKICDPAIGSGAFPMGLLHEIYSTKQTLFEFEHGNLNGFDASAVKLNIIQNSIYGVDIEKGAVDIARLRFWLSLIVDEPLPKPLPNLDYKIVVGDSLVSKLKIGDTTEIVDIDWSLDVSKHGVFVRDLIEQKKTLLNSLIKKQKIYFHPESDKKKLAFEIREIKIDLLINQLDLMVKVNGTEAKPMGTGNSLTRQTELYLQTWGWKKLISQLLNLKSKTSEPLNFFDWKLDFPEVLNNQVTIDVGFDIVIGNPPYGANIDDLIEYFEIKFPKTTKGFKDIYKLFYNQGLEKLLKLEGVLAYITPNTFLLQPRYKDLRQFFLENKIVSIVNLGENVFDEVTVPTAIMVIKKDSSFTKLRFADISQDSKYSGDISRIEFIKIDQAIFQTTLSNIFSDNIRTKADDEELLETILEMRDGGFKYQRVNVGLSQKGKNDLADRLFYTGNQKRQSDIRILIGKDISSNGYAFSNREKRYLIGNYESILRGNEIIYFNKELMLAPLKLVWRQTAPYFIGCILEGNTWFGNTIQGGIIRKKYLNRIDPYFLLALLNSKFLRGQYTNSVKETGRVFPQVKLEKLKPLPIKIISIEKQKPFIEICKKIENVILTNDKADISELEIDLNSRVYKLYEITYCEVKVIDPEFPISESEYAAIKLE